MSEDSGFLPFLLILVHIHLLPLKTSPWMWSDMSCCGFDFHFLDDQKCQKSFYVLIDHLYIFFGVNVYSDWMPIINWVIFIIEFMCSLYIVDTKSFTDNTIGKYFFHSMSFHSFESVLWCTKLFNFDEVYFTYWYGMIFFVTPSSPQKIQMLKPWSLIWSYWVMGPLGDNYI